MTAWNWDDLTSMLFALSFLFVILMTVGFYLSFRKDQREKKRVRPRHPYEGRYFRRFVP